MKQINGGKINKHVHQRNREKIEKLVGKYVEARYRVEAAGGGGGVTLPLVKLGRRVKSAGCRVQGVVCRV